MKLFPYKTFTLQTSAPLPTVKQRLAGHIEAPKLLRWQFSRDHAPYQGTIFDNGFEIRRIIHYRNSFLPHIQGRFESKPAGTDVHITMQLHPLVLAFMCAWGGLWYMGALPIAFFGGISIITGLAVLALPLAMLSLFLGAFHYEAERSHRDLTQLLTGRVLLRQPGRLSPLVRSVLWGGMAMAIAILLHQLSASQPPGLPFERSEADCAQANSSPYCQFAVAHQLTAHPSVISLAISDDGQTLVSGGEDKAIKVWDVATGQLKKTLQSDSGIVQAVAIASDGKTVISGGGDRMVRLWDLTSDQPPRMLAGHQNSINQVAISADGKTAISTAYSEVKLWDLATGQPQATLVEATPTETTWGPITLKSTPQAQPLTIGPDGNKVLVADNQQWLVWDVATQQATRLPKPASNFVQGAAITPGGQFVITVSYRQPITFFKVWDLTTGELKTQGRLSSSPEQSALNNIAVSRDSGDADSTVRIIGSTPRGLKVWNLQNNALEATLAAERLQHLVSSADGSTLAGVVPASAGQAATIQVWRRS
ncbi:MAG: WD40 repeat domain-containing protein [Cyanobacteria bacterium P01_G01_bin.38]